MDNQELINKIQELRSIQPRKEWALLTKRQILGEGDFGAEGFRQRFIFPRVAFLKPALAFSAIMVFTALFVMIQGSMPGDDLYLVKKATRRVNLLTEDPVRVNLDLAAESAKALKEIAQRNEVDKLAPAIEEYQENLKKAVASMENPPKDSEEVVKIAEAVNQIEREAKEIEATLQTDIAKQEREELTNRARAVLSQELDKVQSELATVAAEQIRSLEGTSLTPEQKTLLDEAKVAYDDGDYALALQKIMEVSQNK